MSAHSAPKAQQQYDKWLQIRALLALAGSVRVARVQLAYAEEHWQRHGLQSPFRCWAVCIPQLQAQRARRQRLLHFVSCYHHVRLQRKAWAYWATWAAHWAAHKQAVLDELPRYLQQRAQRRLQATFQGWRGHIRLQRQRAAQHYRLHRLAKAFHAWM
ncbi:hypothetical protein WJX72_006297 [[Myrmecia] bisecta]|uniref:Uncharacterized protein n=1 Tax=[Myrmecia] bisecta TaxID=41462 RepID=A0AAW1Q1K2_9CHLO